MSNKLKGLIVPKPDQMANSHDGHMDEWTLNIESKNEKRLDGG